MCCLSGAAGAVTAKEEKAVKHLLMLGQLRGTDSTGIVSLGMNSSQPIVAKECGPPEILMDSKKFEKVFYGTNKIYLGHNRSRTQGVVKRSNAHPFCFDRIFGAHNGTVHNGLSDLPDQCDTDSETILSAFNTLGVEKTIPKINGAWAFTWYDYTTDTINFLRNKERPLYYAFSKDRRVIFWASMVEMLALALNHNEIERADNPRTNLVPENLWLSFKIPKARSDEFAEPARMTLEGKKLENFRGSYSGSNTGAEDENPFGHWGVGEMGVAGYLPIRSQRHSTERKALVEKIINEGPQNTGTTKTTAGQSTTSESNVVEHPASGKYLTEQRKQMFREAAENIKKNGGVQKSKGNLWPLVFLGPYCRIHYSVSDGLFSIYRHTVSSGWINTLTASCPDELKGVNLTDLINNKKRVDGIKYDTHKGLAPTLEPMIPITEAERFRAVGLVIAKKKKAGASKPWVKYLWNSVNKGWTRSEETFPPLELPFTLLDVRSTHCFHHRGRKKKGKEIYYKGYTGSFLTQKEFNYLMEDGCVGCGRTPEWLNGDWGGMRVTFISKKMFLCEYCDEEKDTFKLLVKKEAEANQTTETDQKRMLN